MSRDGTLLSKVGTMRRRSFLKWAGASGAFVVSVARFPTEALADGKAPPEDADSIVKYVLADLKRARSLTIDQKVHCLKTMKQKYQSKDEKGQRNIDRATLVLLKDIEPRSQPCGRIVDALGGKDAILAHAKITRDPKVRSIIENAAKT
jgi:hypothetical protein